MIMTSIASPHGSEIGICRKEYGEDKKVMGLKGMGTGMKLGFPEFCRLPTNTFLGINFMCLFREIFHGCEDWVRVCNNNYINSKHCVFPPSYVALHRMLEFFAFQMYASSGRNYI